MGGGLCGGTGVGRCVLCVRRVVWRDRSREVFVVWAEGCVEGQE